MDFDSVDRKQLVKAREHITAQLMQLEASATDSYSQGGVPDYRGVYAELLRERDEIDRLLSGRDDGSTDAENAYEPMIRMNADGSVGSTTSPTRGGKVVAVVSIALILVCLGLGLFAR